MESPKNQGGLENPGRRKFFGKLVAVAGAVALGGITSQTAVAETGANKDPERQKEPEKSKNDLEEDYKLAEIERDILSGFDAKDIKNIVKGQQVDGIYRLYIERHGAVLQSKIAALFLPIGGALAGALMAENKKDGPTALGGGLAGAALGEVAAGAMSAALILPKNKEEYLDIVGGKVKEWIGESRNKGLFETEESTKNAIVARFNSLGRKQNEIRKKLDKM